jgi:phosphatidate phosphatase APP1
MTVTSTDHPSQRPHLAARFEDRMVATQSRLLRRAGWRPRVEPFSGYGTPGRVRVLARVVLAPQGRRTTPVLDRRGFRNFFTAQAPDARVRVDVGETSVEVSADRGGYVDVELDLPDGAQLTPGWQHATLTPTASPEGTASSPLLVVDGSTGLGIVSDIDDTAMVTAVPRLFLAAWNTFVRYASARRAVDGMPELYRRIATAHPDAPFVYVSTGAWNTARTLRGFLARNGYPAGPLLLTDWGPTNTGWFRSGVQHKDSSIDSLMRVFPQVRWLLIGDDGQHDPDIYSRAVQRWPGRVAAVAIRELTPAQQVLAHGATTPTATPEQVDRATGAVPSVGAGDGFGLAQELADLLPELRSDGVPGTTGLP